LKVCLAPLNCLICSWVINLWSCTDICCTHRWSSYRWSRWSRTHLLVYLLIAGDYFRCVYSNCVHRSTSTKTDVLRIGRRSQCRRVSCRTSCRRGIHRTCHMAMVVRFISFINVDNSFYINLPIGAITIATIALLLPVPHQPMTSLPLKNKFDEIDFLGLFFLFPYVSVPILAHRRSIVCLLLCLQWGGTVHAWNSSVIIGLFVGFGLMIIIFIIVQIKRGDKATLPLSVLKQRTVASAALFMFFTGGVIFALIYYGITRHLFN
jgi:hypothetical protein